MQRHPSTAFDLALGAVGGVAANLVTGVVDGVLQHAVSAEHVRRERRVRDRSAHEQGQLTLARAIAGQCDPDPVSQRAAGVGFLLAYGAGWGAIYALSRRAAPSLSRYAGLPFAVPFFLACDGLIAPRLGLTPPLRDLPWQVNAKELGNHVAWTATAELIQRAGRRALEKRRVRAQRRRVERGHRQGGAQLVERSARARDRGWAVVAGATAAAPATYPGRAPPRSP